MELNKFLNYQEIKHALFAYFIGYSLLISIFIYTMLLHYDNYIDWEYLQFAALRIAIICLIPAVVVKAFKIKSILKIFLLSIVLAFITAIIYINYATIT